MVDGPIKIAFCITDLDPGGAERALVQLVTRLDRGRWEPAVFCLGGAGALVDPLQHAGIPVVCLNARGRRDAGVVYRLFRELRRFRPVIVQTFLFHANLAGRLAGCLAGVRHCVSGIRVAEKRSRWPLRLDRLTNPLVAMNVCVSQAVADFSVEVAGLPRRKIVVIPNGVDVERFASARPIDLASLGIPSEARILAAVGRLDRQKGLVHLIDAAQAIVPRYGDVHFLLVGDGPERDTLIRQVAEQGLSGRVHFAGWRPDVPSILRSVYGLVLPSLWEGMPNVVLEAMAAGLPVVATRVEGVDELVVPDETGVLIPPASVPDLVNGLQTILADPERARSLGKAGFQRVKSLFSWEKSTSNYDELYRRLLGPIGPR